MFTDIIKKYEKNSIIISILMLVLAIFLLLYKLLSTPDTIFTRQELMEEIWGLQSDSDYRTIDVHIKRIREKMRDVKEFEIESIRGIGYRAVINDKE